MENSYGIGVRNRYALFLDDESDPLELLKKQEQEKELKKKTKVAEKENKVKTEVPVKGKTVAAPKKPVKETPIHKSQDNKREEIKPNFQRPSPEGKPERKYNNENREERNNRRNREDKPFNGPAEGNRTETRDREDRPRREHLGDNFENRARGGRNMANRDGGMRGGLKGRNFDNRRGKREFDRQSGSDKTGVKPVEKRDGGGAHNWGSHKDVIEEADNKTNEIDQTWGENEKNDSGVSTGEPKETNNETETEVQVEVEEPKELTLDEWKAQRAGRQKPQYNIRKAGEGEDPAQWKKMYELKKKDNEEEDTDDEEYDAMEYPQRVGRQKHILDIDIHFSDSRRGGGGGRGRGARAGRGSRSNRERQTRFRATDEQEETSQRVVDKAPKVDDERDFPSLG